MQKPFQAYNFMLSGAYEKFGLNEKHLAVMSGSHSGTYKQIKLVEEILKKSNARISDLLCPKDYPLDEKTKINLIQNKKQKKRIYDNCSGKHAGMISTCKALNLPLENYNNITHTIQQQIIENTLKLCEFDEAITAIDGCGVPVLAMPLKYMAIGLQNLYKTAEGEKIISACTKYPVIFGGKNRLDSEIIKMTKGKVFAKVGACGLVGALNIENNESLIVKIFADDHDARKEVIIKYMQELGWVK